MATHIGTLGDSGGEVFDVRGFIFSTEKDVFFGNPTATGRGFDLLAEIVDALIIVVDGEGVFENVASAVADESNVFELGKIQSDAENFGE